MQAQSVETSTAAVDATEPAALLETNFGNEQPIVTVSYSSLQRSPLNVRTKQLSGIAGLAANVRAKGLLQNLVVHEIKGTRGKHRKYGVCAGQRREAALDLLFEQEYIAADYPVPVRIVSEGEALAISLIENSEREGLDPFDVLRAYRMLADEGRSVDYIAALFSASPITVKRRMKLANVSPKLLALLREDAITLDQLAALALADDHDTQERLWFDANEWQRQPHYLRRRLPTPRSMRAAVVSCASSASPPMRQRTAMCAAISSAMTSTLAILPMPTCCSASPRRSSTQPPRRCALKAGAGSKHASSATCWN